MNELTINNEIKTRNLLKVNSIEDAKMLALYMMEGELVPSAYIVPNNPRKTQAKLVCGILRAQELGLPPMGGVSRLVPIGGHLTLWAEGAAAACKTHPLYEYMKEEFNDETMTAICRVKRRGDSEVVHSFSKQDAIAGGLWGKGFGWQKYPKLMLIYKARGFAMKTAIPEAFMGIYLTEEMDFIDGVVVDPHTKNISYTKNTLPESPPVMASPILLQELKSKMEIAGLTTENDMHKLLKWGQVMALENLTEDKVKVLIKNVEQKIERNKTEPRLEAESIPPDDE